MDTRADRIALVESIVRGGIEAGIRIALTFAPDPPEKAPAEAPPDRDEVLASTLERLTLAVTGDAEPMELDALCALATAHREEATARDRGREAARALALAVESSPVALEEHRTLAAAVLEVCP